MASEVASSDKESDSDWISEGSRGFGREERIDLRAAWSLEATALCTGLCVYLETSMPSIFRSKASALESNEPEESDQSETGSKTQPNFLDLKSN